MGIRSQSTALNRSLDFNKLHFNFVLEVFAGENKYILNYYEELTFWKMDVTNKSYWNG